ncbi:hypothetical protein TNCV_2241181 [Trichonephila clavipes]|nr:hypothetical protein TNCV_2241181 [Trichonephila clavipes]
MSRDILFHICCNLASSLSKPMGCPTHRLKYSQIYSIGEHFGDRVEPGSVVTVRRQSCDTFAVHCLVEKRLLGASA